jgi:hypothetical protein
MISGYFEKSKCRAGGQRAPGKKNLPRWGGRPNTGLEPTRKEIAVPTSSALRKLTITNLIGMLNSFCAGPAECLMHKPENRKRNTAGNDNKIASNFLSSC